MAKITSLADRESGFSALELLFVVFVAGILVYHFVLRGDESPKTATNEPTQVVSEADDTSNDTASEKETTRLTPVNGYEGLGSASRSYTPVKGFTVSLSAALPGNFESTYYEGWLVDSSGARRSLGRMTRQSGQYRASYSSTENLLHYNTILITVDGDATTVEGKSLPHDVMTGSF